MVHPGVLGLRQFGAVAACFAAGFAILVAIGAGGAAISLAAQHKGPGVHHAAAAGAGATVLGHDRILGSRKPRAVLGEGTKPTLDHLGSSV
ncbi:hypothetical protein D9M70_647170 [compost metagenome]